MCVDNVCRTITVNLGRVCRYEKWLVSASLSKLVNAIAVEVLLQGIVRMRPEEANGRPKLMEQLLLKTLCWYETSLLSASLAESRDLLMPLLLGGLLHVIVSMRVKSTRTYCNNAGPVTTEAAARENNVYI